MPLTINVVVGGGPLISGPRSVALAFGPPGINTQALH
jgi:hypothetical protein